MTSYLYLLLNWKSPKLTCEVKDEVHHLLHKEFYCLKHAIYLIWKASLQKKKVLTTSNLFGWVFSILLETRLLLTDLS